MLSVAEVSRLVDVAVSQLGIEEVRLTGGEPAGTGDLELIVATIRSRHPGLPIALTTNGIGLARRAEGLAHAGLSRINVSLDTVDAQLFAQVTRRDRLPDVIAGIDAALAAGLTPVKVNAVLLPETLSRAAQLLRWCRDRGLALRFIESMPLDAERTWTPETLVSCQGPARRTRYDDDAHPDRPRRSPARRPRCGSSTIPTVRRSRTAWGDRVDDPLVLRDLRPDAHHPAGARSGRACSPTTRSTSSALCAPEAPTTRSPTRGAR